MPKPTLHWDIFCVVVDNYGDAGIAWRLARMLAGEHGLRVRLYIDALATLARLAPAVDAARDVQQVGGIEVRAWDGPQASFSGAEPGDVVIEAFGCGLPAPYLDAMAARASKPVWINLEYLSAEKWIEDCHGLASRHPTHPLTRYFFFPGFTQASGGLLRERDLLARRDRFVADGKARAAFWRKLGVSSLGESFTVSLFCYADAPVASLLDVWAAGEVPILCVIPEGVAKHAIERWSTSAARQGSSEQRTRGRLTLAHVPFVSQDDYDRLLWACEANFVRGEDSFVRAQWAARPLVWNVYPQAEAAHRLKLEAFVERYTAPLRPEAASAFRAFSRSWNGDGDVGLTWKAMAEFRSELATHAKAWAASLAAQSDLATGLVKFCRDRL
jgi:uncharacterized repeat protein (TIGR03837 family)